MMIGMAAAIAGSVMEFRMHLSRSGKRRELIASISILAIGIVLVMLQLFHYELPSVFKWIEYMMGPIQRLFQPLLT